MAGPLSTSQHTEEPFRLPESCLHWAQGLGRQTRYLFEAMMKLPSALLYLHWYPARPLCAPLTSKCQLMITRKRVVGANIGEVTGWQV